MTLEPWHSSLMPVGQKVNEGNRINTQGGKLPWGQALGFYLAQSNTQRLNVLLSKGKLAFVRLKSKLFKLMAFIVWSKALFFVVSGCTILATGFCFHHQFFFF